MSLRMNPPDYPECLSPGNTERLNSITISCDDFFYVCMLIIYNTFRSLNLYSSSLVVISYPQQYHISIFVFIISCGDFLHTTPSDLYIWWWSLIDHTLISLFLKSSSLVVISYPHHSVIKCSVHLCHYTCIPNSNDLQLFIFISKSCVVYHIR